MRIVHVVDAAQAQTQVQQRVVPPPASPPPRRVQGINRDAAAEEGAGSPSSPPDDGISLALSPEAREAARQAALQELEASLQRGRGAGGQKHSAEEEQDSESRDDTVVEELERRDREVRAHEQSRAASVGSLAGQPSFTYQVGPNGRLYAVSGEVKIDTSAVPGDPEATLRKAQQIEQAAFAPGDPSPEDRRAAVIASALAARARKEMARREEESQRASAGQQAQHLRETG